MADVQPDIYAPEEYWESRLRRKYSLGGVGYWGLGEGINYWLYQIRRGVLLRALERLRIEPQGASVLEVGPGTGFYIQIWRELGVRELKGVDLTEVATQKLRKLYPEYSFIQADISQPGLDLGTYDIVTAFDVLFHITDDKKFEQAVANLAKSCGPNGFVFVTDLFLHRKPLVAFHQKSRLIEEYWRFFVEHGLRPVARFPLFTLMQPGYDATSSMGRHLSAIWWAVFRALALPARFVSAWGYVLGAACYPLEILATRLLKEGISLELMVAKHAPAKLPPA